MSDQLWLNSDAVEVLDLLSGTAIFSFAALPALPCRVERDFAAALAVARRNQEWDDLRQNRIADIYGLLYEREGYAALFTRLRNAFNERAETFTRGFRFVRTPQQTPGYRRNRYWQCVGDILGDLSLCFFARFLQANDAVAEGMFAIYQSGCWPCGWDGKYPVGQFIVYQGSPDPAERAVAIGADEP